MPESTARIEFPVRDTAARTTLSSGIGVTDTTIPVNRIAGFDDTDTPFLAKLWAGQSGGGYSEDAVEFVRVDSVDTSNNNLTVERNFEGTGAVSADQGDSIEPMTFRASDFDEQVEKKKMLDRLKLFVETGDAENVGSDKADFAAEVLNFKDFAFNSSEVSVKWEYAETGNKLSNVFYDGDTVTDTRKISTPTYQGFDGSEASYSPLQTESNVKGVAIGEGYVVYGEDTGDVEVYNLNDGSRVYTLSQSSSNIRDVSIDEGYVIYGGYDNNAYVHNLSNDSLVYTLTESSDYIWGVAIGEGYVAYSNSNGNTYVHNLSDSSLAYNFTNVSGGTVYDVAITDGYIAYGGNDSECYVHNLDTGNKVYTLSENSGDVQDVAIGEGYVAYGGLSSNVNGYVHDLTDGSLVYTHTTPQNSLRGVAIGNGHVAYCEEAGTNNTYVFNLSNGNQVATLSESTDRLDDVAIGEGYIGYGGRDNNTYVHNGASGLLNANTRYKYRALAEIDGETRKGKIKKFTTSS